MKKATLTEDKAEKTPTGGVLVGKREGQTIIHDKGTLSGYLVGKTHAEGGIKAVNKSTGQPLEMQGGEVVITAPAVSDQTKNEFNGKMMTNREILSQINVNGGGVAFAKDGMEIPKKINRTGASYNYGGQTMTDHEIYKYITGGGIAEDFSIRDIANIHQVPLAELKEEVRIGMLSESEHKGDKKEQMEIVKDHLLENPKYYTLLKKAGLVEENTVPIEKSKWLKQFYVTNNPSIDKLLKDLQPKIEELIEKQKELVIKESIKIFGEPRPMSELDIQFYEAGLIFKMVQAFNKYLKNTDELYDVSIDKRGDLFEVNGKVKRDGRTYKFDTELIGAGGYNIQEYHYRYIIKTDLPDSKENSAVENIKAKMGTLKKIKTIDEDIQRYLNYISQSEKELTQGFKEFKIQGVEHKRDLSDFDVKHNKKRIQDFNKEIEKLEGKKADLISVFDSLDKKGVGVNFGKQIKEAIGRKILIDRLVASKYKETGDTLDFKIESRLTKGTKINTFSFIDEGNGLCTMKAGLELRGTYTPYVEYKNLPIKEIPYKINEIFNGDFSKYLEYEDGGLMEKENLVRDAKSGNTPARDLNNYNDVLDLEADGVVGAETGLYARGGMVLTSVKDIPNFEQRLNERRVSYRGLGTGKLADDFYELAGESGTRIKVDGKEYFITDKEFDTFSRDENGRLIVRFEAPARKHEDGGEVEDFSSSKDFSDYCFNEISKFLKNQNNIDLRYNFTFYYRAEKLIIKEMSFELKEKEPNFENCVFFIFDSEDELVGKINFENQDYKKFTAHSDFFEWNQIDFPNEVESNLNNFVETNFLEKDDESIYFPEDKNMVERLIDLHQIEEDEEEKEQIRQVLEVIQKNDSEHYSNGGIMNKKLTYTPIKTPLS
jgi:hypothetical protein